MFCDAFQWHIPTPPQGDYFTVIVDLLRPLSRNGVVKLNSADPLEQPNVNLNFFSNDLDLVALREGVRFVDNILMNGDGMKDLIVDDYPWPMPRHSDEAMNKMILERSQTGFRKPLQQQHLHSLYRFSAANIFQIPVAPFASTSPSKKASSTRSSRSSAPRTFASLTLRSSQSFLTAVSRTPSIWLLRRGLI
jgi:hypothetical protein